MEIRTSEECLSFIAGNTMIADLQNMLVEKIRRGEDDHAHETHKVLCMYVDGNIRSRVGNVALEPDVVQIIAIVRAHLAEAIMAAARSAERCEKLRRRLWSDEIKGWLYATHKPLELHFALNIFERWQTYFRKKDDDLKRRYLIVLQEVLAERTSLEQDRKIAQLLATQWGKSPDSAVVEALSKSFASCARAEHLVIGAAFLSAITEGYAEDAVDLTAHLCLDYACTIAATGAIAHRLRSLKELASPSAPHPVILKAREFDLRWYIAADAAFNSAFWGARFDKHEQCIRDWSEEKRPGAITIYLTVFRRDVASPPSGREPLYERTIVLDDQ